MTDDTSREYKDAYHSFLSQHPVRSYARREVLLQQDDVPEAVFVIKRGIVKSYNLTAQGEEKPITFILKDEVFPIGWVLARQEKSQYYYEALSDVEVYVVPHDEYIRFLKTEPACLFELHRALADRNIEYQMRINALEQSRASDKVLYTLQFMAHRFGKDVSQNIVRVELPFTQQDLANFMGLARETTAIELKKLERDGTITYGHHMFTIHISRLLGRLNSGAHTAAEAIAQPAYT